MVQSILMVALILLMIVSVACGVYAVVLLKQALDAEKKNQSSSSELVEEPTRAAQHSDAPSARNRVKVEKVPQMYEASLLEVAETQSNIADAHRALEDTHREVRHQTAAAIAELQRVAAETQINAEEEASKRVSEEFSQYGEVRTRSPNISEAEELESSLTQKDVDRWASRGHRHPQKA
jgi:hypothetical protein